MELVFFRKEPSFATMKSIYLHVPFYFGSAVVFYFASQTIFYEILYHPDNLYLPLFVTDLKSKGISHWYLPPSTYAFPDMFLMYGLSFCVSLKTLPAAYGILNLTLILLSTYLLLKQELGQSMARIAIHLLLLILLFSILVSYFHESSLNLFAFLFTSGHHTSAIYLFFCAIWFFRKKSLSCTSFACSLVILFFSYLSDRYLLLCFLALFFVSGNRRDDSRFFLTVPTLLAAEVLFQYLTYFFHIPSSFPTLIKNLSDTSLSEFFLNNLLYFYVFIKLYVLKVNPLFHLISVYLLIIALGNKKKMRLRPPFFVFGFLSFCFLGMIGRYAFPHPFPIRYLIPSLYCFFVYGLILNGKKASPLYSQAPKFFAIAYLFLCLIIFFTVSFSPPKRERLASVREGILSYHLAQPNKRFWTSYIAEKKLRFWSENQLQPLPCDPEGKPYLWITGAFANQFEVRADCPGESERIWLPNSLTKDF